MQIRAQISQKISFIFNYNTVILSLACIRFHSQSPETFVELLVNRFPNIVRYHRQLEVRGSFYEAAVKKAR